MCPCVASGLTECADLSFPLYKLLPFHKLPGFEELKTEVETAACDSRFVVSRSRKLVPMLLINMKAPGMFSICKI